MSEHPTATLEQVLDLARRVEVARLSRLFKSMEVGMDRVEPPLVIRLDGVSFSRVAKVFGFPRSPRVHEALVRAGEELARFFNSELVYVVSDEINVFLINRGLPYGGRLSKVVSVSASIASAVATSSLGAVVTFDSRIVKLSSPSQALDYLLYRARVGSCNYVNTLFTKVLGLSGSESVEDMVRELSRRINEVSRYLEPRWKVFGTCVYFDFVEREAIDRVKGCRVTVRRRVLRRVSDVWECLRILEGVVRS